MGRAKIDCKSAIELIKIIKGDQEDEKKTEKRFRSKVLRQVRFHDRLLGRKSNIDELKNEIKNINKQGPYIFLLEEMLADISNEKVNDTDYLEQIFKLRLSNYLDIERIKRIKVYLYVWKYDLGFSLSMNKIYLNLYQIAKKNKNVNDILVHEVYHARKVNLVYFIKNRIYMNSKSKLLSKVISSTLEEGIATLIEKGVSERFKPGKENREKLNQIIISILREKKRKSKRKKVTYFLQKDLSAIYECGYYIANIIYLKYGREALDNWTVRYDWKYMILLVANLDAVFFDDLIISDFKKRRYL